MIPNFLLDNPELAPVAMAIIAVVCVGVGFLLMRASRYGQRILWVLAGLSLLPVVALTLVPTFTVRSAGFWFCVVQFSMPTLRAVELLANVALFFPLIFFATLATRKPLLILAAGTALSGPSRRQIPRSGCGLSRPGSVRGLRALARPAGLLRLRGLGMLPRYSGPRRGRA